MKKYLFVLFAAVAFAACKEEKSKETEVKDSNRLSTELVNNPRSAGGDNPEALEAMPTMTFKDSVFDFGTIKEGDVVRHEYEFTNNGKNPLIISNAKGSCGCTVPEYPTQPVPPGKNGVIKVEFHSEGKSGHQEKSVTITTNSNRGMHTLYIKGNVK